MERNIVLDALMGVAVGDALGVPVEFKWRKALEESPVTGMMAYGSHNQPIGTWSDDSSLTFCLAESLCNGYDLREIGNRFVNWYRYGYWTPHGVVFDVGRTTADSIINLEMRIKPPENCGGKDEKDNGNGSLMRILPIVFNVIDLSDEVKYKQIKEVSSLTHAHMRSVISCCIYIELAANIIRGMTKTEAMNAMKKKIEEHFGRDEEYHHFHPILKGDISTLNEEKIESGGYVVESLEASLWSFLNGDSYKECLLKAVNLGGDTDTVGAITGGLAGLFYGFEGIPKEWIEVIVKKEEIFDLADRLKNFIKLEKDTRIEYNSISNRQQR